MKPAEFHGDDVQPRVKWTCANCSRRNDTRLQVPVTSGRLTVFCQFCRRPHVILVVKKETA